MKLEATFAITGWDQAPYDEPADGPPLIRATVRKDYAGALEGSGVAELLTCGELAYAANERVTGHAGRARGHVRAAARRDGGPRVGVSGASSSPARARASWPACAARRGMEHERSRWSTSSR